jgi:hypothetical protein
MKCFQIANIIQICFHLSHTQKILLVADYSLIQLEIDSRMTENINTRNHKTILLCLKHLTVISGPEAWYLCTDNKHRLYFETETT